MKSWLKLGCALLGLIFVVAVISAWREDRRTRASLQAELAATKKTLADLDAKQQERAAQLSQTLTQLAQQKKMVRTSKEALRSLPEVLPLPLPIQEQTPPTPAPGDAATTLTESSNSAPARAVVLPNEDLKPLYDFAIDCQACQAKLAASQADLADEKLKTQALSRERDDALRVARGGSFFRRFGRAAKWFAIGAAAGAIAAGAAH